MILGYRPWSALAAVVLLVWSISVIDLNWPGHLSVDSLIQIEEGRTGVIKSYNPIFITMVFGKLAQLGGTPLLITCATLMLAAAVWGVLPPADRFGLPALAVLASALCAPVLLIYPAIVWKDVWFAHAALLGFALIAQRRRFPGWVAEAGCALLFAMAMLSRQTGGIVAVVGMATLAWARHRDQAGGKDQYRAAFGLIRRAAVYLVALFTVALGLAAVARLMVQTVSAGEVSTGLRLLFMFDIAGMVTRQSVPDLTVLAAFGVDTALLVQAARATFSAERIDALDFTKLSILWQVPFGEMLRQWWALAAAEPLGYLFHRTEVFSWLLGLQSQFVCLPVHVGIADPDLARRAGVNPVSGENASDLYTYAQAFVGTPYFSPATWASLSLAALGRMAACRRVEPVIAGMQIAALAYLLSYLPLSISCDFRYTYFCFLSGTLAAVWLVNDLFETRGDQSAPGVAAG